MSSVWATAKHQHNKFTLLLNKPPNYRWTGIFCQMVYAYHLENSAAGCQTPKQLNQDNHGRLRLKKKNSPGVFCSVLWNWCKRRKVNMCALGWAVELLCFLLFNTSLCQLKLVLKFMRKEKKRKKNLSHQWGGWGSVSLLCCCTTWIGDRAWLRAADVTARELWMINTVW